MKKEQMEEGQEQPEITGPARHRVAHCQKMLRHGRKKSPADCQSLMQMCSMWAALLFPGFRQNPSLIILIG